MESILSPVGFVFRSAGSDGALSLEESILSPVGFVCLSAGSDGAFSVVESILSPEGFGVRSTGSDGAFSLEESIFSPLSSARFSSRGSSGATESSDGSASLTDSPWRSDDEVIMSPSSIISGGADSSTSARISPSTSCGPWFMR